MVHTRHTITYSRQINTREHKCLLMCQTLHSCASLKVQCRLARTTAADDAGQPRYCRAIIKSGVKPSISGDLWSEGGMGLFGIFAHGITETWVMEKALIGLVACEKELHTAVNNTRSGQMRPSRPLASPLRGSWNQTHSEGSWTCTACAQGERPMVLGGGVGESLRCRGPRAPRGKAAL